MSEQITVIPILRLIAVDNTCVNFIDNIPAVSEHRAHGEDKFNAHTVAADTRFYDKSQSCAQTDFMVKNSLVNQSCSGINGINLSDTEPCFSATLNIHGPTLSPCSCQKIGKK